MGIFVLASLSCNQTKFKVLMMSFFKLITLPFDLLSQNNPTLKKKNVLPHNNNNKNSFFFLVMTTSN